MDTAQSPVGPGPGKRRMGNTAPLGVSPSKPAVYEPSPTATSDQKEQQMRDVTADHGRRIGTIVEVLTLINRRLDEHDLNLSTVEANDLDMKKKLASLEDQAVSNDQKLKSDLGSLEDQVVANDQKIKIDLGTLEDQLTALAQAVGATQHVAAAADQSDKLRVFEERIDKSLKGLETAIQQTKLDFGAQQESLATAVQQVRTDLGAQHENLFTTTHGAVTEIRHRLGALEGNGPASRSTAAPGAAFPGTWSQHSDPAPAPSAVPGQNVPPTPAAGHSWAGSNSADAHQFPGHGPRLAGSRLPSLQSTAGLCCAVSSRWRRSENLV